MALDHDAEVLLRVFSRWLLREKCGVEAPEETIEGLVEAFALRQEEMEATVLELARAYLKREGLLNE